MTYYCSSSLHTNVTFKAKVSTACKVITPQDLLQKLISTGAQSGALCLISPTVIDQVSSSDPVGTKWCFWPSSLISEYKILGGVKPVLNWANVCSPNILQTLQWTMIRFLIELLVRRIWFGLYFILNWLVMRCKLQPEPAADSMIENAG